MKLKVLCLHGYRQDKEFFKQKLGAFRKITKDIIEFVFIDAPHVIPDDNPEEGSCPRQGRGWWFSTVDSTFNPLEDSCVATGFEESVKAIDEAFQNMGPFDGIFGFSQGAAMAAIICGMKEAGEFYQPFDFVMIVAGFRSKSSFHDKYFAKPFNMHSLHIMGDTDKVIPKEMSQNLLHYFPEAKVINHPGGHFLPTNSVCKNQFLEFLHSVVKEQSA